MRKLSKSTTIIFLQLQQFDETRLGKNLSFRDAYKDMSGFSEKIPNEANDEVWIRTTASASPSR